MIETKRLLIRPVQMEDASDIFEYAKDEDTGPMAGWPPHKTIEDTKEVLDMWLEPESEEKVFAIVYKPDNKVVGTMGVTYLNNKQKDNKNVFVNHLLDDGKQLFEVGNTISKAYWGKGISTECLTNMIDYIFETTEADIIITCHYAENLGSKKVQEKCRMKEYGSYERDKNWYNTDCNTMVVRGKTREEWLLEKNNYQENSDE